MAKKKHVVKIENREFELHPMRGRKARTMVPRILSLVSGVLYAALKSGVNIPALGQRFSTWIDQEAGGEGTSLAELLEGVDLGQVLLSVRLVLKQINEDYDAIEKVFIPYLLCMDEEEAKWLEDHGDLWEVYEATALAIRYHLQTSFGKRVGEAIKNLAAAEQPPEKPPTAAAES